MLGRLATWPRPWGLVRERRTARGPQGHGGPERVDSVVPCHCGAVARWASAWGFVAPARGRGPARSRRRAPARRWHWHRRRGVPAKAGL
jgi:hypothetical protein